MPVDVQAEHGRVRLLEADPALADGLTSEQELEAREQLIASVVEIGKGPWEPPVDEPPGHLGYLVLSGLLTREVAVERSRSVELLSAGDLLRPWQDDPSSYSISRWSVLEVTRIAVLDPEVARRVGRHPEIASLLVKRVMSRTRNLAVHWAIANTVGLEKRILMLFRHLAERWGRVTPDGVAIPLRITHQMVADLVGARRPSATTALVGLAESGALRRTPRGGWLLRRANGEADPVSRRPPL